MPPTRSRLEEAQVAMWKILKRTKTGGLKALPELVQIEENLCPAEDPTR